MDKKKKINKKRLPMNYLHPIERPREKLIKYGPSKLKDEELLAIILRQGYRKEKVIDLSKRIHPLLKDNRDFNSWEKLKNKLKIGSVQTCQIIASYEYITRLKNKRLSLSINSPINIWEHLVDIRSAKKEYFVVFYLNVQNTIIHKEIISIGSLNASIVHPREIFEPAVRLTAGQIIIAHNHPSGNTEPSKADIEITKRIYKVGELMGIPLLDHIIVTKNNWLSFKEAGILSS